MEGVLMFMCDKCHDADNHPFTGKSVGPCEGCGKTAACIDCHYAICTNKKKRKG